jgi:alpha-aminoadipate carrier protein LysW
MDRTGGREPPRRFALAGSKFDRWFWNVESRKETTVNSCPECAADIEIAGVVVGEILQCNDCSVELEVLSLEPINLGLAPAEEEDWGE